MRTISLVFLIYAFVNTSCRKERTCECVITTTEIKPTTTKTTERTVKTTKDKQRAKEFRKAYKCYNHLSTQTNEQVSGSSTINVTTNIDHKCEVK
jgi:endo-1,4-beta-mannosidase